jgi:hypothetical protein
VVGKGLAEVFGSQRAVALAGGLMIPSFDGGKLINWPVNKEQAHVLGVLSGDLLHEYKTAKLGFTYVLKPRQIGITTSVVLWDVIWTAFADMEGRKVHTALIWDKQSKLARQIALAASFSRQLGIPMRREHKTLIEFPNGSTIEGLTAGGSAVGRGLSYHRFHLSELPFWKNPMGTWAGIQGALNDGSQCTIETTMDMGNPFASEEWDRPNDYAKVFLPVEWHTDYRRDASDLSSSDEEWLRGEGFTNREAMAWWVHRLNNRFAGDRVSMMREYPQLVRHCFTLAEGRWVQVEPEVVDPVRRTAADGLDGVRWMVDWFRHPEATSGYSVISVDTALAANQDKSAVIAVDKADGALIACFASNRCHRDDLARVACHVKELLTPKSREMKSPEPTIIVETNGPGKYTWDSIGALGGSPLSHHTDTGGQYAALLHARRALESRTVYGPQIFAKEARELYRKGRDWLGEKDCLMALGIAMIHIEKNPYPLSRPKERPTEAQRIVASVTKELRAASKRRLR